MLWAWLASDKKDAIIYVGSAGIIVVYIWTANILTNTLSQNTRNGESFVFFYQPTVTEAKRFFREPLQEERQYYRKPPIRHVTADDQILETDEDNKIFAHNSIS